MDLNLSNSSASAQPYPPVSSVTHNPPPQNLEESSPSLDRDAFMNQLGHATIINTIIDQNKETIMANFLRDNVGVFGFGRPQPLDISDLAHLLFGRLPPPIVLSDPNDPFFIPQGAYQTTQPEPIDPNIPSTQLSAPIPPKSQPTIAQSLVHKTPQQPSIYNIIIFTTPPFTSIFFNVTGSSTSQSVAFIPNIPTSSASSTSQSNIQPTS